MSAPVKQDTLALYRNVERCQIKPALKDIDEEMLFEAVNTAGALIAGLHLMLNSIVRADGTADPEILLEFRDTLAEIARHIAIRRDRLHPLNLDDRGVRTRLLVIKALMQKVEEEI